VTLPPAGLTLGSGASALCPAEAPEPKPGPSPASSQRMAARLAHLRTFKRIPNHVMLLPAGLTLGSGASALCLAEAQAPKPGPSPALSQRMAARPVHQRVFKRSLNLVMPQPVGQISLTGQHARVFVVKMGTRQGKGHASSLKMEASHAQRKLLKHRHKSVELLASG